MRSKFKYKLFLYISEWNMKMKIIKINLINNYHKNLTKSYVKIIYLLMGMEMKMTRTVDEGETSV